MTDSTSNTSKLKQTEFPGPITESISAPIPADKFIQSFNDLNLSQPVLDSLAHAGFTKPTPIQAQFIPVAMTGRDVMGQAKTGTGKTAAFLLPIFEKIKPGAGDSQALVLAPTRELALQIHGEIARLGSTLGFSSITLYGGSAYEPQIEALATGVDIIVGTPGRIMDHMRSKRLDLSGIKIAVLDEADRMLDLGFRKDIEFILRHCPAKRQTLLLSATIADDIKKLAGRFMLHPAEVWTATESITVDAVEQHFIVCERTEKLPILLKLLEIENPSLAIIFCTTKIAAKKLADRLKRLYISAKEIHGDLQQSRREKIMGSFRTGKVQLLIATDVASRGIDVDNITHIINYDIPYKIEDYVHRIGRTGRMEKSGKAFTFVTREEGSYLTEIELLINKEIKRLHFDDLTSKWWPVPPAQPPAGFDPGEPEVYTESASAGKGGTRKGGRKSLSGGRRATSAPGFSEKPVHRAAPQPRIASSIDGPSVPMNSTHDNERKRRRAPPASIICSQCGKSATVCFKPNQNRPVYCEACFRARKAAQENSIVKPEAGQTKSQIPEV